MHAADDEDNGRDGVSPMRSFRANGRRQWTLSRGAMSLSDDERRE